MSTSLRQRLFPRQNRSKGFTIVELLIVVVVIAILAAITLFAYNGITNKAKDSAAQSAAEQVAKKVALYAVTNSDDYPATLSAAGISDDSVTSYQYSVNNAANPRTYCATVTVSTISYFVSNAQQNPKKGGCPGHGQGGIASVTNLVTNPSFETAGAPVEVRRNLYLNPINGGTQTAGLSQTHTAYVNGAGVAAPTFAVSAGWQQVTATNFPAGAVNPRAGYRVSVPLGQTVAAGMPIAMSISVAPGTMPAGVQAKLYVDAYDGSGNFRGSANQLITPNAGSSVRVNASITPTGDTTSLSWYIWFEPTNVAAGWSGSATIGVSWSTVEIGRTITGTPFYGGGLVTPDADLTPSWTGTANASASILQGSPPAAATASVGDATIVQSSDWSDSGTKSLRIIPKSTNSGSFMDIYGVLAVGKTYTIIAKVRLTAPQTGTLAADARKLAIRQVGSATAYQYLGIAPNAAGTYELRGTATVASDTTIPIIRVLNGASVGNGDVWVDSVMAVEVPDTAHPYTGPARYGDSTDWIWNGTANASTSTGPGN